MDDKIIALICIKLPVELDGDANNAQEVSNLHTEAKKYLISQVSKNYQRLVSDIGDEFIIECADDHVHWIKETVDELVKQYGHFSIYAGLGDTILEAREAAEAADEKKVNGEIEIYHFLSKSEMLDQSLNVLDHIQQNKDRLESLKDTHPRVYDSVCKLVAAAAKKVRTEKERVNIQEEIDRLQAMEDLNAKIAKHNEGLAKENGSKIEKLVDILIERKKQEYLNTQKIAKEHGVDPSILLQLSRMTDE